MILAFTSISCPYSLGLEARGYTKLKDGYTEATTQLIRGSSRVMHDIDTNTMNFKDAQLFPTFISRLVVWRSFSWTHSNPPIVLWFLDPDEIRTTTETKLHTKRQISLTSMHGVVRNRIKNRWCINCLCVLLISLDYHFIFGGTKGQTVFVPFGAYAVFIHLLAILISSVPIKNESSESLMKCIVPNTL